MRFGVAAASVGARREGGGVACGEWYRDPDLLAESPAVRWGSASGGRSHQARLVGEGHRLYAGAGPDLGEDVADV